jgi:ligand-binding SRPBCC domain-containing protein
MIEINVKQHIAAPPETVFQYASDFVHAPQRIKGIVRVEMLSDGPVGVGTRFKETRVMFKRECTETMEVTAFDSPRRFVLGCESCGCRYQFEHRFTPSGDGTDLELSFQSEPVTRMAKIMSVLMKPMMKSMLKQCSQETARDLADLKAAIEQDGPAGQFAASTAAPPA